MRLMSEERMCRRNELDLNNRQRTACGKHAGAARYAYNWGLARRRQAYEQTGNSSFTKAEGMVRFYLRGKRLPAEQDLTEALLDQKDAILAQVDM